MPQLQKEHGSASLTADVPDVEQSPPGPGTAAAAQPFRARATALTSVALLAFASNSILCRLALSRAEIDPATYTAIRLVSGAVVLGVLAALRRPRGSPVGGSWGSAAALAVYAVAFSYAYVSLDAGIGALLLFGSVQATIILSAISRRERPTRIEWAGLATALGGLVYLVSPGLSAPPLLGSTLMVSAGAAWGVYTVRGRRSPMPVLTTAGNFLRGIPFVVAVSVAAGLSGAPVVATRTGIGLALASGILASGFGYVVWYAALQHLTGVRAAAVQLVVPVLGAAGGILVLGESISARLIVASALILGGVGLALARRR